MVLLTIFILPRLKLKPNLKSEESFVFIFFIASDNSVLLFMYNFF